ncbi:MAG: shikimate kinase [Lachnospiraceae bacterium]|nr:shikimate kinase [Lachnospiraceae bacterium]
MKRIVLMGFMGVGKTTVGKRLARELELKFIDTDERIESEQGRKISDIFAEDGETAFRDMETDLLKRLQSSNESYVLSIGGGMPVREENRVLLRDIGTVVYLNASKEEIIRRVSGDTNRPLLQGGTLEEKVTSLMKAREHIYVETAHKVLHTDGKTVSDVMEMIETACF